MCELVGALILSQLSNIFKYTDIYRNDGLIIIRNPNGPKIDRCRKRISNALKLQGFKITIYINLKIENFLDLTLNLRKGTFETYKKRRIRPSTTILFQTTLPQLSNKYQNQLAADNLINLSTPTFSTKQTHIRQRTKNLRL